MPRRAYGRLEDHIIDVFRRDRLFEYYNRIYEVLIAGKPRPRTGECKTDVFVRARETSSGEIEDFKISVKNENKEFMGNKLKAADLEAYIGPDWEEVVMDATLSLEDRFRNALLLYATRKHPTCANSITVGWKLEITDRPRNLSVPIPLSDQEIRDFVYKGTNLSDDKKNSYVDGKMIENSGVAEFLITTTESDITCANDVIEQMEYIDDADIGDTYFIFTANNYRTDVDKADGPRALAVRIEWACEGAKLVPHFCFDSPLYYTGERDMAPLVKQALRALGKRNIDELEENVDVDLRIWKS